MTLPRPRLLAYLVLGAAPAAAVGIDPGAATPPAAGQRPHKLDAHGETRTDDYFWLKDKTEPRGHQAPRSRERLHRGRHEADREVPGDAVQGVSSSPDQADRPDVPVPGRRVLVLHPHRRGEAVPDPLPQEGHPRRGRRRCCSTCNETGEGATSSSASAGADVSDDGNLLAYATDTTGLPRVLPVGQGPRGPGKLRRDAVREGAERRVGGGQQDAVLRHRGRTPSGRTSCGGTRSGSRRRRTRSSTRRRTNCSASASAGRATGSTCSAPRAARPPPSSGSCPPTSRPASGRSILPAAGRRTSTAPTTATACSTSAPTRTRDELQGRDLPGRRRPTRRTGRTSLPYDPDGDGRTASTLFKDYAVVSEREAGMPHLRVIDLRDRQAAPRSSSRSRSTRRVLGGEPGVRHRRRPVHLHVAGHPAVGVRVRPGDEGAEAAEADRRCPAGTTRTSTRRERVFATAPDGTKVPISLVYKKGLKKDGTAPCLLYGYGSYGSTMPVGVQPAAADVCSTAGVVFAQAHIRGGSDLGRHVVRRRQDAEEEEHVHRLHRLRRPPGEGEVLRPRPAGDPGRQRRRAAGRGDDQPAAGPVQGGGAAGAVRGRGQHDARRDRCR